MVNQIFLNFLSNLSLIKDTKGKLISIERIEKKRFDLFENSRKMVVRERELSDG